MADEVRTSITHLLEGLSDADPAALDAVLGTLYDKLRMVAHQQRRRWRGDETLGTTALVHEAYLKLRHQKRIDVRSREHFLALASRAMRHILSNYAEKRRTQRRGGGLQQVSIGDGAVASTGDKSAEDTEDMLAAMNRALERLEQTHARSCRVVECRFYGGLTIEETAAALEISPRTVKRDWAFAQAWLKRELKGMV